MLVSTFAALRTQGVPTGGLRQAAVLNFNGCAKRSAGGLPDHATQAFWKEVISVRRTYRMKTGHNIEDVLSA
jgi:hypothetical protein